MCLNSQIRIKEKNEIKKDISKDGIEVYKIVGVTKAGKYVPLYGKIIENETPYTEGLNVADTEKTILVDRQFNRNRISKEYKTGFHFWMDREEAQRKIENIKLCYFRNTLNIRIFQGKYKLLTCIVKKSWITTIGLDDTPEGESKVIVSKKAIFPKFSEEG